MAAKKVDVMSHVIKLGDRNYWQWKIQVTLILKTAGAWNIVRGVDLKPVLVVTSTSSNAAEVKKWEEKDVEAQCILVNLVEEKQLSRIQELQSSKEMWDKLEANNADSSLLNKQHTLSKFYNYKIREDMSLTDAFSDIEQLARSLNQMGRKMDDADVVTRVVTALPDSLYAGFKESWASVPDADQTTDRLQSRLKTIEFNKVQKRETGEPEAHNPGSAFSVQKGKGKKQFQKGQVGEAGKTQQQQKKHKRKGKCNNCETEGHWARECRKPGGGAHQGGNTEGGQRVKSANGGQQKKTPKDQDGGNDCQAFMVLPSISFSPESTWVSDSGASSHFTGRKDWLRNYKAYATARNVSLSNKDTVQALGQGDVDIEAFIQGKWIPCTIRNVTYIPGAVNLFSEGVMDNKGFRIVRENNRTTYFKNGIEGPQAHWHEGAYLMLFRPKGESMLSTRSKGNATKLWHDRLAHVNIDYIKRTVQKGAVSGIDIKELGTEFHCSACHLGKEAQKPYPKSRDHGEQRRDIKPGEIIHGDLGIMPSKSLGGATSFLLLKDQRTGFRHVTFLNKKGDAAKSIITFIKMINRQSGHKVKIFKSDNGGEFICGELADYFRDEGILHETSTPYCHPSNGKIEREMLTIKNTARSMLQNKKMPDFLWAEAVGCSVYIHNRLLNKQSPDVTPFEQIFGYKPDLSHIRTFGSKAYAHVPKETRKTLDPKAKIAILVGYNSLGRSYRLYNPETRSVFKARNVSFYEGIEPLPEVEVLVTDEDNDDEAEQMTASPSSKKAIPSSPEQKVKKEEESSDDEETTLVIDTYDDEQFEFFVEDGLDETVIEVPARNLRNRDKIKAPNRYQALRTFSHTEPKTYKEALQSPDADYWMDAMRDEIQSLEDKGTWTLVERPQGVKVLDPKWVYKLKKNPEGEIERYKARLVIRGFRQEFEVDYFDTFATVARYESIRFVLALAAAKGLKIQQFDVKVAFLNGELDETLFMRQPQGFENHNRTMVCHLHRSLYGLKQAPRNWNLKITNFLRSLGLEPINSDPCVFTRMEGETILILALYVDDGLVISTSMSQIKELLGLLGNEFQIEIKEPRLFVGIELTFANDSIILSQGKYVREMLEKFRMVDSRPASVPMQPNFSLLPAEVCNNNLPYRELIGSLLFLARVTRPDISFAVSKLSQFTNAFSDEHWQAAKGILRYLRGKEDLGLVYTKNEEFVISGWTDSDYAGCKIDRKSTSGYAFFVNESLVSWSSQKQDIVALSSTESEYIALSSGAREAVWLRRFAEELFEPQTAPTLLWVDNTSAIRLAENPEFHKRSKHIDVRYHFTRELVEARTIEIKYVPTQEQRADIFTKPLAKGKHEEMREKLGLKPTKGKHDGVKKRAFFSGSFFYLLLLGLVSLSMEVNVENSQPVLWRGSKTPVISGYQKVHLRVKLVPPCTLITSEVVHADLTNKTRHHCDEMYKSLFIDEITKMCPQTVYDNTKISLQRRAKRTELITRHKRWIQVAAAAAAAVVFVGMSVTGITMATLNKADISKINEVLCTQEELIGQLNQQLNFTEIALAKLRHDVNLIVNQTRIHDLDWEEYKQKGPSSWFVTSYVTNRLLIGKQTVQGATRAWRDHKLDPGLLDFFNLTMPCKDSCPIALATTKECQLSHDNEYLDMELDMPIVNEKLQLVEADAFDIMFQTWNQTCRVKYTGPQNAILSKVEGCPVALNLKLTNLYDLVLSPSQNCLVGMKNKSANAYFKVDQCYERRDKDAEEYIQVKPNHGSLHIYCYGNDITLDKVTHPCPKGVFVLPIGANFKINEQEFVGSIVNLEHQEGPDPLFSMRVNLHLKPKIDYQELLKDPMVNNHFDFERVEKRLQIGHGSLMEWGITSGVLLGIILILTGIIIKCYADNRRVKVRVVTKRKIKGKREEPSEGGHTGEMMRVDADTDKE